MPTFDNVEVQATVDIEFEVFCEQCGAGLCGESNTRSSRNRGTPQVTVNPCSHCVASAKEDIRDQMQEEIDKLEERIRELEEADR